MVEELQIEVDLWMNKYKNQRIYSGKHCYGKTPMQTFHDSKHIALKTIPSDINGVSDSKYSQLIKQQFSCLII